MKKNLFTLTAAVLLTACLLAGTFTAQAQSDSDIDHIDSLMKAGKVEQAYLFTKEKYTSLSPEESGYRSVVIVHFLVTDYYEQQLRFQENFNKALEINKEMMDLIHQHKKLFNKDFATHEYFNYRNLVVCHTGLGQYAEAQKYRKLLYNGYKKEKLPCEYELCHYFNFDFFKIDTLNVWGYEWYDPLPKNRFSSSFTKIVYYVYSTDDNGDDKDLMYRLHVLMFHGTDQDFDYIMDKRISSEEGEISGSMYSYTYKEKIDYQKLHNDVMEIVREGKGTDTQRFTPTK